MSKYIGVYQVTENTDSDIISSIDVVKSFLYNSSIPIYENNSINPFIPVKLVRTNVGFCEASNNSASGSPEYPTKIAPPK